MCIARVLDAVFLKGLLFLKNLNFEKLISRKNQKIIKVVNLEAQYLQKYIKKNSAIRADPPKKLLKYYLSKNDL